jgi:hypothetical protein
MEGHQWADYEEPRELEPEVMAAADAVPEAESGGDHQGMGKAADELRGTTGGGRKRMTPVGKGPKRKPAAGKRVKTRRARR